MSNPHNPRPTYGQVCGANKCIAYTTEEYGTSYARPVYHKPQVRASMSGEASPLGLAILLVIFVAARHKWIKSRKRLAKRSYHRHYYHD